MLNFGQKQVQLLDCTLRDGGYYTRWDFDEKLVEQYFQTMNKLPVEYIEIGYRSKQKEKYQGAFYYLPEQILKKCEKLSAKKLAVILNEKELQSEEVEEILSPCVGIVDMVRLAVAPDRLANALKIAEAVKKMDFLVSLNLMYASKWEEQLYASEDLKRLDNVLDYFYVVDSYGGMLPSEIKKTFTRLKEVLSVKLCFHGHNNIEMALVNSLTAIESGAVIIDATVCGMGRGAGNLKTELFLSLLHKKHKIPVDFDILNDLVENFLRLKGEYKWGTNLPYMLSGAFSLPQNTVMGRVKKRFFSLNAIVKEVSETNEHLDNPDFPSFTPDKMHWEAIIVGGGNTPQKYAVALREYLKKNPETCVIHSSSKNVNAFMDLPNDQFHCLSGKEIIRLEEKLPLQEEDKRFLLISSRSGVVVPEKFSSRFKKLLKVLEKGTFQEKFELSTTAMAIDIARLLNVQQLLFTGYDGYAGGVTKEQLELFEENQEIFEEAKKIGFVLFSLTPTLYMINSKSIFSLL
ncbi:aldolase catalytic domain-containing protein [Zunongwangia sp. H14]|uniref:aldolase catalytic domain-containing protein n=1 Tax=Zunongwangia sp. H14 TaxID=3240792 RepID=UPI003569795F